MRNLPFTDGQPVSLSIAQWMGVMAGVLAGVVLLFLPVTWPGGRWGEFIPATLLFAMPLAALAAVAGRHWRALFGPVGWRELRWMVAFALLNIAVSMTVGLLVQHFFDVAANPAGAVLSQADTAGRLLFFAATVPQLLGEEVITVLPFLAIMALCQRGFGTGRRTALVVAWLLSAVLFGLLHLSSYDWHWVQCIVVIGSARLVLSLAWLRSRNLWVSTGAHVINDWLLLGIALAVPSVA